VRDSLLQVGEGLITAARFLALDEISTGLDSAVTYDVRAAETRTAQHATGCAATAYAVALCAASSCATSRTIRRIFRRSRRPTDAIVTPLDPRRPVGCILLSRRV
jgi:hypothetical protein